MKNEFVSSNAEQLQNTHTENLVIIQQSGASTIFSDAVMFCLLYCKVLLLVSSH